MRVMARWGDMSWFIGPQEVRYLEGLSTSYSMKTDTSSDKDGKTPTETVGLNEIEVSCSTSYRIETGTKDINAVIEQWKAKIGQAEPLFIGTTLFGAEKMQLQSVSVSDVLVRPQGIITAAKLAFKFKEFRESVKSVRTGTTAASGGKSGSTASTSAVAVTASTEDKKKKKTYDDIKAEQTRDR